MDFGVGRGRVSFYTHHKFQVPVTGIEVNDITFDELLKNQERYQMHTPHIEEPLYFHFKNNNYRIDISSLFKRII